MALKTTHFMAIFAAVLIPLFVVLFVVVPIPAVPGLDPTLDTMMRYVLLVGVALMLSGYQIKYRINQLERGEQVQLS